MGFILIFIHRWLEKVTNQYFSVLVLKATGKAKHKEPMVTGRIANRADFQFWS